MALVLVPLGALQGPMDSLFLLGEVSPRGPPQGQTRALSPQGHFCASLRSAGGASHGSTASEPPPAHARGRAGAVQVPWLCYIPPQEKHILKYATRFPTGVPTGAAEHWPAAIRRRTRLQGGQGRTLQECLQGVNCQTRSSKNSPGGIANSSARKEDRG